MNLLRRLRAFLDAWLREPMVEVPAAPSVDVDAREVWGGPERRPTGGWRLIGRGESPLEDYL